MATITSAQSGNFSNTATWVGGVVPTVGDIAVAATGHIVTIDVDVTCTSITQAGTGKFTIGGGRTLTANVTINAGTRATGGTLEANMVSGSTAYIIGNIESTTSSTLNTQVGVAITGVGTLQVTGNITGTPGNTATQSVANAGAAIWTNTTCVLVVSGSITGGTGSYKYGIFADASSNISLAVSGSINGSSNTFSVGTYAAGASASVALTGNITGGGGTSAYALHMVGVSGNVTIQGDVTGGTGTSAWGIYTTGNSSLINITGNLISGTGSNATSVYSIGSATAITITGNVTAGPNGSAYGVHTTGISATIAVTGNIQAGAGATAHGLLATGTSAVSTITGNITGGSGSNSYGAYATGATSKIIVTGDATSTNTTGNAIRSNATTTGFGVIFSGNMKDSATGATSVWAQFFQIQDISPAGVTEYSNTLLFPSGGFVSRVSPDNVTGMPAESDVRDNLTYGYNNELEGMLAVPPSGSVALGVPVDDTVGVAALTPAEVWNYLAASATTPNSLGAILANIVSLLRDDAIDQIITYNRSGNTTLSISGSNDYRTFNINTSAEALPIISFGEEL